MLDFGDLTMFLCFWPVTVLQVCLCCLCFGLFCSVYTRLYYRFRNKERTTYRWFRFGNSSSRLHEALHPRKSDEIDAICVGAGVSGLSPMLGQVYKYAYSTIIIVCRVSHWSIYQYKTSSHLEILCYSMPIRLFHDFL